MDFHLYVSYWPLLLRGILYTLYVCSGALVIGLLFGLCLCVISQQRFIIIRALYRLYITLFRGTPLLVQLFLVFYGGPFIGLRFSAVQVGMGGLGLYTAAYFAEIFRAGFESIPSGEIEAAFDLGLSPWQIFWHIRIPQMLALIVPTVLNQTILLVKESAVLSIITVPEMMSAATKMSTETYSVAEPYLFLGVCYWLMTFALAKAARQLEKHATRHLFQPKES
ncbi:amino acid ABC transporter permease [Celerinatantimonas sp. MCCC 1A17872]|uniref:amino acid ABC transporter permease n=1 Tax=Celerinatantimonas sp. MCCC 1A17872 TaxID=3177514 RepID=UPI0038BF0D60